VANGIVYVGTMAGRVLGFPVGCGEGGIGCEAIWVASADGPVEASPVVAESRVVVGTLAGSVQAFAVACGDREAGCPPLWTATTGGPVRSSAAVGGPASGGAILFVGSDDGFVYAYRLGCAAACQASWASGTRAAISASPALVDGVLYVSSEDGTVRAWSLP
jgi:outer membrane protein assembly factor BamB